MSAPVKLGSGNSPIIVCAMGSIRLPATPGAGSELAGGHGWPLNPSKNAESQPGLMYVARLLNGMNVFGPFATAPPALSSWCRRYGSQICPAATLHRPVLSNEPPFAEQTSPKSPARIESVGT